MLMLSVNWLAVIVVTIFYIIMGMVWYSPKVFGTTWMKLDNIKSTGKGMTFSAGVLMFLTSLVTVYGLAVLINSVGANNWVEGLQVGLFVWLAFFATTTMGKVLWEMKSWKVYLIISGYWIINFAIGGIILGVWK